MAAMNKTDRLSTTNVQPRLHYASDIRADPALACTITAFVNEGYRYISPDNATHWEAGTFDRLPTPHAIHEAIGQDGLFAVVYDPRDNTTPVACAAAKRWKQDLDGFAAVGETGWELIAVTTRLEWMRSGLADRCINALVEDLVGQARDEGSDEKVQVWAQAVEALNGAYWRKKGWVEVRTYEKPQGRWGSRCGYKLLVLLREFEVNT